MKLKNNDKNCSYSFYISDNERNEPLLLLAEKKIKTFMINNKRSKV